VKYAELIADIFSCMLCLHAGDITPC